MSDSTRPNYGVRVFAISGTIRRSGTGFLAYGLEYLDGVAGAVLSAPPLPRWRWLSRRMMVVQGRDAEEIMAKLPLIDARLVRLDQQWHHTSLPGTRSGTTKNER